MRRNLKTRSRVKKRKLTNRIIKVRSKKKTKRKIMKGGSLFKCSGRPKRVKNKGTDDDLPICPITQETVEKKNAVTDIYGHTYNRKSILEWIKKKGTSPMNRQPLQKSDLQKGYTNKNAPPKPEPEPEPEREREPEPEPEPTPVAEFREGESVLYESSTHGVQIPCTVGQVNDNGTLWLVRNIGGQIKTVQVQADPRFVVLNHAPAQARLSTVAEDGGYPTGGSDGSAPVGAPKFKAGDSVLYKSGTYSKQIPCTVSRVNEDGTLFLVRKESTGQPKALQAAAELHRVFLAPAPADWSSQYEKLLGELCIAIMRPNDCGDGPPCGVCDAEKFLTAERIATIEARLDQDKGNPRNLTLQERLMRLNNYVLRYIEGKEATLRLTPREGLGLAGRLDAITDEEAGR